MSGYSTRMLQHFKAPRNAGALSGAHIIGRGSLNGRSPRLELYLQTNGDVIERAGFTTFGCGAAIACGSALTEMVIDKDAGECREITAAKLLEVLGGLPPEKEFCASIAIAALSDALKQWNELLTRES